MAYVGPEKDAEEGHYSDSQFLKSPVRITLNTIIGIVLTLGAPTLEFGRCNWLYQ